tara:strand:- start:490 stop:798 length:309 start_codon:yes stop_codon:yes gene_type:complete
MIEQTSGVSFSLSFLIQLVSAIVLAVWGYSQLDGRISALQNSSSTYAEAISRIEDTMRSSQDAPISSDHVQNTTLFAHERELLEVKNRLQVLETRLYELRIE